VKADVAIELTAEDHDHAMMEVAFLVDAFASTIDNVMGGATGPVGRVAGRDMAKKLPLHLGDPSLAQTLAVLNERMKAGFDVSVTSVAGDVAEATVGTCFIRDLCTGSGKQTGGAACKLYHAYFDGIVNELMRRPVKSEIIEVGLSCRIKTVTQ
jgi:hypothetical protein